MQICPYILGEKGGANLFGTESAIGTQTWRHRAPTLVSSIGFAAYESFTPAGQWNRCEI